MLFSKLEPLVQIYPATSIYPFGPFEIIGQPWDPGPSGLIPVTAAMEHSPALTRGPGAWRPATGAGSVPTRRPFMVCPNGVYSLYILIYINVYCFKRNPILLGG